MVIVGISFQQTSEARKAASMQNGSGSNHQVAPASISPNPNGSSRNRLLRFENILIKKGQKFRFIVRIKNQLLPQVGQGLMGFYCYLLRQQAPELLKMSRYLGADASFSKKSFVDTAIENGLHLITRLRDNAVLYYAPPS